jgi:hypothetical protein
MVDFDALFQPFLAHHPESSLKIDGDQATILRPWGDDTLELKVPVDPNNFIEALNSLRLPPRFSALWHLRTNEVEFIYGPLRPTNEILKRSFTFTFKDKEYTCKFAPGSDLLKLLARSARFPSPPSATDHRNLGELRTFLRHTEGENDNSPVVVSFWLNPAPESETDLTELSRHLNFFMHYYDRLTPQVVIHDDSISVNKMSRPVQHPLGDFPNIISGRPMDPYLLSLWDSSVRAPDPMRRFLYSYQIFEFCAFYFIREELERSLRRILLAPDVPGRIPEVAHQLLDAVVEDRTSEDAKMTSLFQQVIDPAHIWPEIQARADFFSQPTDFEGGLSLSPLIKPGWDLEDFRTAWVPKLPDTLRKLRNALVHAREQRMSKCVAPTLANRRLLMPWAILAVAISSELLVYGDTLDA